MANWTESTMNVILPSKNVKKFLDLFSNDDHYFARTDLIFDDEEVGDNGISRLDIDFTCAWSVWSCMFEGYPQGSGGQCPTLEEVCKELDVLHLTVYSTEPGIGFIENIEYTHEYGMNYESHDINSTSCGHPEDYDLSELKSYNSQNNPDKEHVNKAFDELVGI